MTVKINLEFFNQGYTWMDYISTIVKRNKSKFEAAYEGDKDIIAKVQFLEKIKDKAPHWLAIAEDWCYDSVGFLPVVARLAAEAKVDLRIFPRDKNPELMDQYLTHNKKKIPIVIFFDKDFEEVGRWIERPRGAHQLVKGLQAKIHRKMASEYDSRRYSEETTLEIEKQLKL